MRRDGGGIWRMADEDGWMVYLVANFWMDDACGF